MPDLWADSLEAHRDLVRQRLLTAFADLAAEVPLDDITLTAVAERAGLARSAVQLHHVGRGSPRCVTSSRSRSITC